MDLGLQCHVCGQLNLMSAQACGRCGTVLHPGVGPEPVGAASRTVFAPSAPNSPNTAVRDPTADPLPRRFDPATGQPIAPAGSDPMDQPQAKTMFFGALQQQPVIPRLVVIK